MNDCYFEKRDWRQCKKEVRLSFFFEECDLGGAFPSCMHCTATDHLSHTIPANVLFLQMLT